MPRKSTSNRYTVRDAAITTASGRAEIGDVVELDGTEAKHFSAYLAPFISEDEESEEEVGSLDDEPGNDRVTER